MKSQSTKDRLTESSSEGFILFLNSGVDYYVAGRFALFAGLLPTGANLLHHAVEMFLKGALRQKGKTLKELKNLQHRLPDIWNEFKINFPKCSLDTFDPLISELHKFEEIRYQDLLTEEGGSVTIELGSRPPGTPRELTHNATRYRLYLAVIDELVGELFSVAKYPGSSHFGRLDPVAKKYLHERNKVFPAE